MELDDVKVFFSVIIFFLQHAQRVTLVGGKGQNETNTSNARYVVQIHNKQPPPTPRDGFRQMVHSFQLNESWFTPKHSANIQMRVKRVSCMMEWNQLTNPR